MKKQEKILRGASWLALALTSLSGAAAAQETVVDGLEEIVVTAQRRSENLQDTPISISALTAETIENAGIGRLEDFSTALPNVYITPRDLRTSTISIRGISADLNNPGLDQSVGVYVDGVYMGRAATINSNLFDLERIETLRGPQGTLYGRNTIAGAVNIITRRPTSDPRAAGEISYGSDEAIRANAVGAGPLSHSVFASLALSLDQRDGLVENTFTGTDLDDLDSQGARLAFVFDPGDDWDFTLRLDASRDRTHSGAFDIFDNGAFTGAPFADASPTDRSVSQSTDTTQNRDIYGGSGELNWRLAGGVLTSITAFRGYDWENIQDSDYTVLDMLDTGITEQQTQASQEIRFASDSANRFSYVGGLFYYLQRLETESLATIGPDLGIYPTREAATIYGDVDTTSYAAFGRGSYRLSDTFSLAAGLRYTREDKSLDFSQTGDPFEVLAPNIAPRTIERSDDNLSISLTAEWRPSDDTLAYATFSQGFKSGGFNVFSVTATDDGEYRPETVNNYEIGFKSEFFNNRLRFNASAFYMQYEDLQQNQLIDTGGGILRFQTSNAAEAHSQGLELEIAAAPTEHLQLTASYSVLNAEFDSYPDATPAGDDFSGNRLAFAPETSASFAAEWTQPVSADLEFFARGEAAYRNRIYFGSNNAFSDPPLTVFNARLGIGSGTGTWRATIWGRNLTDEEYVINRFAGPIVPGQVVQALGPPQSAGVEIRLTY